MQAAAISTELPPGPEARNTGIIDTIRYGLAFLRDPFGFVGGRFERYGDIYYAPSGGVGLYVLRHPDHIRDLLVTQADAFEKTHTALESLSSVLGQGLLTSDGDVWRRHRRLLGPAFAKKAIEGYAAGIVRETAVTLSHLRDGQVRDVAADMTDLTLRIVGRTLLGIDVASEVERVARAMRVFQSTLAVPRTLPRLLRWPLEQRTRRATRDLDDVVERVIRERRAASAGGDAPRNGAPQNGEPPSGNADMLQLLLDATDPEDPSDRLSPREIRDELVTFLLAGHETTSNTLTWALYLVSQNPEVERALQAEVERVLEGRLPGPGDLERLVYTEQIVKEAMRLYPPAFLLARRAARDATIGSYRVPRGSEVIVWTYFTHRDPRFYPDPEAFRPERFTPEAEAARPKQAYLPFGAGPRACIGRAFALAEATLVLACLAQRFTFRYPAAKPPRPRARITLGPAGGLRMKVESRRPERASD